MTMPVLKIETRGSHLVCDCGHTFTEEEYDCYDAVRIYADIDCRLDDFNIYDYTTEIRECPTCSCCTENNGEINEEGPTYNYLCPTCLTKYEDEDEAAECCEEEA